MDPLGRLVLAPAVGALALTLLADTTLAQVEPPVVQAARAQIEEHRGLILHACYLSAAPNNNDGGLTYVGWNRPGEQIELTYHLDVTYKDFAVLKRTTQRDLKFVVDGDGWIVNVVDGGGPGAKPFDWTTNIKGGLKAAISVVVQSKWVAFPLNMAVAFIGEVVEPGQVLGRLLTFIATKRDQPEPDSGPPSPVPPGPVQPGPRQTPPGKIDEPSPPPSRPVDPPPPVDVPPPPPPKTVFYRPDEGAQPTPDGTYCFAGSHPDVDGRWEVAAVPHRHDYAPFDVRLFAYRDGCYFFVGDPVDFGYTGTWYAYLGYHPVPDAFGGGWCFMEGLHRHLWRAWSPEFVPLGPCVLWNGAIDPAAAAYQPYYAAYFSDYYPTYYEEGRFYQTRSAAPPIATLNVAVWGRPTVRAEWGPRGGARVATVTYVRPVGSRGSMMPYRGGAHVVGAPASANPWAGTRPRTAGPVQGQPPHSSGPAEPWRPTTGPPRPSPGPPSWRQPVTGPGYPPPGPRPNQFNPPPNRPPPVRPAPVYRQPPPPPRPVRTVSPAPPAPRPPVQRQAPARTQPVRTR